MFGMTKKQFLKKSKNCLKETGIELLLIREIFNQEINSAIDLEKALQKLENVRKRLEDIFFQYEHLNPPSKCKTVQLNILNALIILQESVVINSEYLILLKDGLNEPARDKLEKSIDKLDEFRHDFKKLSKEVDLYLPQR